MEESALESAPAVLVDDLSYAPLPGGAAVLQGLNFSLPKGARCLFVGPNGAGKSTLLQLLSGAKMAPSGQVKVLSQDPFRGSSGAETVLISGGWRAAGGAMEERMAQMKVFELLGLPSAVPPPSGERTGKLCKALGVEVLLARFYGVLSEGERCRVELLRQLREPKKLILLDEVTSELDMVVRKAVFDFLAAEPETTVLNVTHVFEGMGCWASHVLHLQDGQIVRFEGMEPYRAGIFERVATWIAGEGKQPYKPLQGAANPRHYDAGPAIAIADLNFSYDASSSVTLKDISLPSGCRCVLFGLNGAGKSTFLAILAGRRMAKTGAVRVLGLRAFYDHAALDSQVLILSSEWKRQVAELSAARQLSFKDLADKQMKELVDEGLDMAMLAGRLLRLMQMLAIDPAKPVGLLSDGAMRRVQIALKLIRPARVLLVDEVTADLDVLARQALLSFLGEEAEEGCAVLYCTHIMDGLEGWASHLLHLRPCGHLGQLFMAASFEVGDVTNSDSALSQNAFKLLCEDSTLKEQMLEAKPEVSTLPAGVTETKLPFGWNLRGVSQGGAFGNYAWKEETKPEEEWSFKSVAPPPPEKPGMTSGTASSMLEYAGAVPGFTGMAGAIPVGMPGMHGMSSLTGGMPGSLTGSPSIPGVSSFPGSMPGLPGGYASGSVQPASVQPASVLPSAANGFFDSPAQITPAASPVSASMLAAQAASDPSPFGSGMRQNQMTPDQLVRRGIIAPENLK